MSNNYCIALQPICDRDLNHIADELLYRPNAQVNAVFIDNAMMATARACNVAFYEIGIEKLIGQRQVLFNAPRDWLLNPDLLPANPQQVIVEVLENVRGDPAVIEALTAIRKKGYHIALDDFVLTEQTASLLNVATIVKIDDWKNITEKDIFFYKNKGLKILAEKVEEVEDFEHLRRIGFDYFQGYFYAKPKIHTSLYRNRSSNQAAQLRILSAFKTDNVDLNQLENLIIQDPQLAFMLLKYANTAYYHRHNKAITIQQALKVIGLRTVRSIVMTGMLANNGPASRLLLPSVLTRASMFQRLAELKGRIDPDLAFTVGLLSRMDLLVGMPLTDILKQLAVSQVEIEAILEKKGELGALISLIDHFEKAEVSNASLANSEQLNSLWLSSRVWVENILQAMSLEDKNL